MKIIVLILISVIVVVLLLGACAIYLQVIYVTTPLRNRNVGTFPGVPHKEVTLTAADGVTISGWYVPGTRPYGIVVVHGIHANRTYLIPQAAILADAGYHVILIDLRGHGLSEGAVMTYGYREALDVQAAVDYLTSLPKVDRVGALGHSLGAAAVVKAAALNPQIEALVIQSSYSSLSRAVDDAFNNFVVFPRRPLGSLIIALAERRVDLDISQVNSARDLETMHPRPVMIIHGAGDKLFMLHHAYELYNSAQEPKELWIVDTIGHVNPMLGHEMEYKEKMLSFFEDGFERQE